MSRINIIALVSFAALLVWVFTLDRGTIAKIHSSVLSLFGPFQRTGTAMQDEIRDVVGPTRTPEQLAQENDELRREVSALRLQTQEIDRLLGENRRFRELLDFEQTSALKVIPARVIGRDASTWWNTVVIDRGFRHQVAVDSPVVTDVGLVGKTAFVNQDESTVILLTDERCRVAARIQGTSYEGILMGSRGATRVSPDLRLRFLPKEADPPVGSAVFSSNVGGLFPSNILLGEIKQFTVRDVAGEALVRPAVDFSELEYVFVIEREDAASRIEEGGELPAPGTPAAAGRPASPESTAVTTPADRSVSATGP